MLKIGMIDSGMGGLSVLKGLVDSGVNAEYYYLYDNKPSFRRNAKSV